MEKVVNLPINTKFSYDGNHYLKVVEFKGKVGSWEFMYNCIRLKEYEDKFIHDDTVVEREE